MRYRFAILDIMNNTIVRASDNETEIRKELYEIRKRRYIDEHPGRPVWEYDTIKHDNGYNLIKYAVMA